MRTVSVRLVDLQNVRINLGFVGENEHTLVRFDCKKVFKDYPDAVPSLAVLPPKGDDYPVVVTRDGDFVEWTVTDSDLIYDGDGGIQLTFTDGTEIQKTYKCKTVVHPSIGGNGTIPTPIENWVEQANEKLAAVEAATEAAESAAEHMPYIGEDGYWYEWNGTVYVKSFKAQGEDGAPGQKGDKGDPGIPGDPTQLLDDDTPSSSKAYSSAKVDEELTDVKTAIQGMSIQEDEHFEKSVNMFDMTNSGITRGELWWPDGTHRTEQSNEYATSHLILVEPGTYKFTGDSNFGQNAGAVALYNLDGTFNKMNNATVENNICTVIFIEYGFAQFNIYYASIGTVMFTKASEWPEEYEPYYEYLKKDKLPELEIGKEDTNFFEHEASENIFSGGNPIVGKYINIGNGGFVNENHYNSYLIPVKDVGSYWTISETGLYGTYYGKRIAMYNKDEEFIGAIVGTLGSEVSTGRNYFQFDVTASHFLDGLAYLGITTGKEFAASLMVYKGNAYPQTYVPYKDEWHITDFTLKKDQCVPAGINELYGKLAVFDGDSICNGATDTSGKGAYAGRIAENNKMRMVNGAVSGGTLTSGLYESGGSARHWVSTYIDTLYSKNPDADFIIFEGGTNDADLIGSILDSGNIPAGFGSWTADDFSGNYDDETFCGAVETIIYKAMNYWPHSKIGFVIAPKMGTGNTYKNRYAYFETIMNICKKWGMPYINLWEVCPMNPMLSSCYDSSKTSEENIQAHKLYKDGQHPTPDGYARITPMIEAWMRTL